MAISFKVLTEFIDFINEADIPFALISRIDTNTPINLNDIDIVVEKINVNTLLYFLKKRINKKNFFIFNIIKNDYSVQIYVSFNNEIFNLDILSDFTYRGLKYLHLTPSRDNIHYYYNIPIINDNYIVLYSILRNILWRGAVDERYNLLLNKELLYNRNFLHKEISNTFGDRYAIKILDYLTGNRKKLKGVSSFIIFRSFIHRPINSLNGIVRHFYLLLRRFIFYPGLFVVVLGPDGSGKTTLLNLLSKNQHLFQKVKSYHLFPGFLYGSTSLCSRSAPVKNPHDCLKRGPISSILKLFFWFIEFSLGFAFRIWKPLEEGHLVLFDRYYHDLFVDTKRYRYGGPMWLAKLIGKTIPNPDLFILLDAPPDVLQSRKKEVPFAETARQRESYLKFVLSRKNGIVINGAKPIEGVAEDARKEILEFMKIRTQKALIINE